MTPLRLLSLLAFAAVGARAGPVLPLGHEEAFVYRVSWAIFPGAGEIRVWGEAGVDSAGKPEMRISTRTHTRGVARALLTFEARAESLFDSSGRLLKLTEMNRKNEKLSEHAVSFDYAAQVANYAKPPTAAPLPLKLPAGDPMDLITSLLQTRTWNLKPGEKRDALVLFDDDFYELTIHAIGYETVSTKLGDFRSLILEPRMEKTPPKGMFKKGSSVRVWITQDERRLPVRFQVDFKFGSGIATLNEYRPPSPKAPVAASPGANEKNSRP